VNKRKYFNENVYQFDGTKAAISGLWHLHDKLKYFYETLYQGDEIKLQYPVCDTK
jgi:hypothetical protein